MKRLQRYYYLVGTPVFLLVLGAAIFFPEISATVKGNPHPQINYAIFVLIVGGAALMLLHIRRINKEGLVLGQFVSLMKTDVSDDKTDVRSWLEQVRKSKKSDVVDVLDSVLDHFGKPLSAVQHAALETEISHFQAQQQRRLLLAQFLSGMMVGLGLFGTFIGLLGALQEIGKLIGSFAVGPGMNDPLLAVTELVTRLTEPMKSMGVAFSASLFGVLGSLIMGMLMVFVKGANAELIAMLQSRVSWLTDLSSGNNSAITFQPVHEALAQLAEHSPLLQGLTVALDQSEQRVKKLLTSMQEMILQVHNSAQVQTQTYAVLSQQNEIFGRNAQLLDSLQAGQEQVRSAQERAELREEKNLQILTQLGALLTETLSRQEPVREALQSLQQIFSQQGQAQNSLWQDSLQLAHQQQQQFMQMQTQLQSQQVQQANLDREQWVLQLQSLENQHRQSLYQLLERLLAQEQTMAEHRTQWQQMQDHFLQEQNGLQVPLRNLTDLMVHTTAQWRLDCQLRAEQLQQTREWVDLQQVQHEQLLHALLRSKSTTESS